jgi:hypothetical protein
LIDHAPHVCCTTVREMAGAGLISREAGQRYKPREDRRHFSSDSPVLKRQGGRGVEEGGPRVPSDAHLSSSHRLIQPDFLVTYFSN